MSCDANSYAARDSNDVNDTVRYRRAEILRGTVASIDSSASFSGEPSRGFTVSVYRESNETASMSVRGRRADETSKV